MADEHDRWLYRSLVALAIVATIAWIGWSAYDGLVRQSAPGDYAYHAGTNYFADGHFELALREYDEALREAPEHFAALRGRAETLIELGRERDAIGVLNALIDRNPRLAALYANLGIAYDRLGAHRQALIHYERALSIDPEIGDGPGWLTRFLRNQADKPPGIADRARYLREQWALPPEQRVLQVREIDAQQRPYKP